MINGFFTVRWRLLLPFTVLVCFFSGCRTVERPETLAVPLLLLENTGKGEMSEGLLDRGQRSLSLPISQLEVTVENSPTFTLSDLALVHHARVDLGECLLIQMTPAGARKLYRLSVANQGARLVLVINEDPIGFHRFDQAIADGNLFMFVEVPDSRLPGLIREMNATLTYMKAKDRT